METENTHIQEKTPMGLVVQKTRILTPKEYNKIRDCFKKQEHKLIFDGMIYTSMRVEEFWRFISHPEWFDYDRMCINLPPGATLKIKAKQKGRTILLSALGVRVVRDLLDATRAGKIKPLSNRGWNDDITRAARRAGFQYDPNCMIVPKMTRKTYISWLMAVIPDDGLRITASSGHDSATMLTHYLNLAFTDIERNEIKMHIQGWGGKSI
jgi:integrase